MARSRKYSRKKRKKQKKIRSLLIFLLFLFICLSGLAVLSGDSRPRWLSDIDINIDDVQHQLADTADSVLGELSPYFREITDSARELMDSSAPATQETPVSPDEDGYFRVYFLDVGQGLSVFVEADGHYLLYDGGDRDASSFVVAWLKQKGITHLDYLIASHYDSDHINGLVGALHTVTADTVMGPSYTADSRVYESFLSSVSDQGKTVVAPSPGDRYFLGDGYFDILAPLSEGYSDVNNYSIVLRFVYGENSILLTGDAESESEEEMLNKWPDLKSDILCVGHHGSPTSSSGAFLDRVSPSIAVISCGKDNSYGHPDASVLERLSARNIRIFRTDENGTVTVSGSGNTFEITSEK